MAREDEPQVPCRVASFDYHLVRDRLGKLAGITDNKKAFFIQTL